MTPSTCLHEDRCKTCHGRVQFQVPKGLRGLCLVVVVVVCKSTVVRVYFPYFFQNVSHPSCPWSMPVRLSQMFLTPDNNVQCFPQLLQLCDKLHYCYNSNKTTKAFLPCPRTLTRPSSPLPGFGKEIIYGLYLIRILLRGLCHSSH